MIRFQPHYQPALWGGRRLEEEFGRDLPKGEIGESWELVELPERESPVAGGPYAGKKIGELWRAGALGGSAKGGFPFLLKWIDAAQKLSVQVHPDAAACAKLGKGAPKTEAWYVAYAEPKATLLIGHHPGLDPLTLKQAATGGTLQKWLYETRPRAGDMFLLEAGTVHAIGAGFLLLEVQQPSDTTFRIYDWGRVGADGQPRALHLEEAAASVAYNRYGAPRAVRQGVGGPCFTMRSLRTGLSVPAHGLRVLVADAGPARLTHERGEEILEHGDVVVAEPKDGAVRIASGTVVLLSEPGAAGAQPVV
jgi:mannose-6-phosphate isomerase